MYLINKITQRLTLALVSVGFVALVLMMLHIAGDVFLRSVFDTTVPATERIVTRYYMVSLALLPLAWVELNNKMIAVDAFSAIYGKRGIIVLSILTSLIAAAVYFVLSVATWQVALEQFNLGSYIMSLNLVIPLWPTYFVVPIAFFMAALVASLRCISLIITHVLPKKY